MLRAYDLLSGRLIRAFNERSAPRHAMRQLVLGQVDEEFEAKWAVGHIRASREGFVASIGAKVLAWRAGIENRGRTKKVSKPTGRVSTRLERYRGNFADRCRDDWQADMLFTGQPIWSSNVMFRNKRKPSILSTVIVSKASIRGNMCNP